MKQISAHCPECKMPDKIEFVKLQEEGREIIKFRCTRCNITFDIEEGYQLPTASNLYAVGPHSISTSGSSIFYSSEDFTDE